MKGCEGSEDEEGSKIIPVEIFAIALDIQSIDKAFHCFETQGVVIHPGFRANSPYSVNLRVPYFSHR